MTRKKHLHAGNILCLLAGLLIVIGFLLLPLIAVFAEALRGGVYVALNSLSDPDALSAIRLTLLVTAIAVPVNTLCGIAAAWVLSKFSFPGQKLLSMLIDLPLSISPVVAGLVWILLFGTRGWWGAALQQHGIQIAFATPGIVLATLFVTFPYVARTILPLMQSQGTEQEEAAVMLGAGFGTMLRRIVVPDIGWALLSGVLLCTARAMGEFGAVSVISGHIPGVSETMPVHIQTLYDGYQSAAAFAMAAVLALSSIAFLALRRLISVVNR
ncbi:sulfate ABC transporter permease [Granulibacter bethesdensis]|uniref:Sulfate transport system permease protein cysW n=1 Tax=Granulibacter bethesdensis (strain ATCC BAA-1260 / CGDNIH1) TaxID=391165 RepID=Q0BQV6_GRABC|nr:sulfate ABC transporter permease subunit [Granulibacter bethesdensis]ABI62796.1 Sulfate transport system permease protein cysW [Granulibacter bethesdensis CGDNIH1]APH65349.1 Sulfate transport system permease protein cysW [Granulibacter bethesdensis]